MHGSYEEFWERYLHAHADRRTRALHYAGSSLAVAALAMAATRRDWRWLIAAPLVGYGLAWTAHAAIEGNRPPTFGHPVWSLLSDARMLGLAVAGRLGAHLERAGVPR
ncbi:MAG TPA: DUF962 domain-containing protein [Acetobacteraceae bacterium]|nr:DUF962 domain-containing protein [Acetobacteraceae bacterium]